MTPALFLWTLLLLNLGASVAFGMQNNPPWCTIYLGAAIIQAGCLWASR